MDEDREETADIDIGSANSITLDLSDYGGGGTMHYDFSNSYGGIDTISIGSSYVSPSSGSFYINDPDQRSTITCDSIASRDGKKIDINDLADLVQGIKDRLLILTPNFEMHEKYPMLKELYDEYKAMEKLLSGPDRGFDEEQS